MGSNNNVLTPDELQAWLFDLRRQGRRVSPFNYLLRRGKILQHQLQEFAKDGAYFRREIIPAYTSAVYHKCPVKEARLYLLSKLKDEENHFEPWVKFGMALGVPRDEMEKARPLPATKMAHDMRVYCCTKYSWLGGLAIMAAGEGHPELASARDRNRWYISEFPKLYSWLNRKDWDEWGSDFHRIHEVEDATHGSDAFKFIKEYATTPELQAEVMYCARFRLVEHAVASLGFYNVHVRPFLEEMNLSKEECQELEEAEKSVGRFMAEMKL